MALPIEQDMAIDVVITHQSQQIEALEYENQRLRKDLAARSFRSMIATCISELPEEAKTFVIIVLSLVPVAAAIFAMVVIGHFVWPTANGGPTR